MIGTEELNNEEENELKVVDRRKFNVDGSLRDGVTIEKEVAKAENQPLSEEPSTIETGETRQSNIDLSEMDSAASEISEPQADDEISEDDIMNDENPASFVNFLSTLVTNAAASLGAMPHPVTGQKSVDLDTGKYWIDVLVMLREKTRGNLKPQEQKLLEGILGDLQMQFVALTKATEEKLKVQAAKKFSSKDILGG